MSTTEAEAKTKWCPMGRAAFSNYTKGFPAVNRQSGGKLDSDCKCVASACMMWRQAQKPNPDWRHSSMSSFPMPDTRFDPPMYIDDTERGYCGLGGRP